MVEENSAHGDTTNIGEILHLTKKARNRFRYLSEVRFTERLRYTPATTPASKVVDGRLRASKRSMDLISNERVASGAAKAAASPILPWLPAATVSFAFRIWVQLEIPGYLHKSLSARKALRVPKTAPLRRTECLYKLGYHLMKGCCAMPVNHAACLQSPLTDKRHSQYFT